jgi:FkbM family methyltransferase
MMGIIGRALFEIRERFYSDRIRMALLATGVHEPLKSAYQSIYESTLEETRQISVSGITAEFYQQSAVEQRQLDTSSEELPVMRLILESKLPGDVIWDVGANIGVHACLLQKYTQNSGHGEGNVIAFEPHPSNAKRLRENAKLNELDLTVHEAALFSQNKEIQLQSVNEEAGEGKHTLSNDHNRETTKIPVKAMRGDEIIDKTHIPRPNIIKIDVEGSEMHVLKGLTGIIESTTLRLIIVEVHREKLGDFGHAERDIQDSLEQNGFEVQKIHDRGSEYFLKGTRG